MKHSINFIHYLFLIQNEIKAKNYSINSNKKVRIHVSILHHHTSSYLAIDTIIQSAEYNRLSKRVSPHLLVLHQFTSGQELIPSKIPSCRNLIQLEIKPHIQQEVPFQTFLLQPQTSATFQKDFTQQISSSDAKTQILQTEIDYLQKQHAEAIAIGDFTQQLAAERAISSRFQTIKHLPEKQKTLKIIPNQSTIDNQESSETSLISSAISDKSLVTNQVDQQIRELLKKHVKILRKRIRNDKSKLDQKESLDKQVIHSVEDLRQLSIVSKGNIYI